MPQPRAVADPSVANPEIFAAVGSGTRPAGEHAHLATGADRRAAGTAAALRMPGGAAVPQPREPCYDLLVDVLVHISDSGRLRSAVSLGDYARAAPSTSSPTGCAPRTRPGTGVAKPDGLDGTVGAIRAALLDGASPVGPSWPYELLALVLTAAAARPPLGALGWPDDDFAQRGARTAAVSAPPSCAARWSPTSPQCSTPSIASRGRRWRDAYVDAPMRARRARAFVATLVARSAALDALLARSVDRARRRSASVSCPHTRPEWTTVPDRSIARPCRPLLYGPVA